MCLPPAAAYGVHIYAKTAVVSRMSGVFVCACADGVMYLVGFFFMTNDRFRQRADRAARARLHAPCTGVPPPPSCLVPPAPSLHFLPLSPRTGYAIHTHVRITHTPRVRPTSNTSFFYRDWQVRPLTTTHNLWLGFWFRCSAPCTHTPPLSCGCLVFLCRGS